MDVVVGHLQDTVSCPICGATLGVQTCPRCGADYRGVGQELWDASQAAIAALEARQSVLDRVVQREVVASPATAPQVARAAERSAPGRGAIAAPAAEALPPRSSATVQSVLAVAGAGLLAIAAIVFTFFNPDLADPAARGWIVGAVTAAFVIGAAVLARRGLQFSAEAVGALGVVFLALDVQALTSLLPTQPWIVAAAVTPIVALGLGGMALRFHVRVWLTAAVLALSIVPAMIGYAAGAPVVGHLAVAVAAFALLFLTTATGRTWASPLRAESIALTVIELAAVAVAVIHGGLLGGFPPTAYMPALCGTLAAAAVIAIVSTRHLARGLWSFLAGALGTASIAVLPWAVAPAGGLGAAAIGAVPAAAIAGAILWVLLVPAPRTLVTGVAGAGALTVAGLVAVPATATALLLCMTALGGLVDATPPVVTASAVLGLGALGAGILLFTALARRLRAGSRLGGPGLGAVGLWLVALAALALVCLPAIEPWARVTIGLALGAAVAIGVAVLPWVRRGPAVVRTPLVTGAHLLVIAAAVISWHAGAELATLSGVAVVAAIILLARSAPERVRFLHVGVGYAYALVVVASAMALGGVTGVALLCLITSLAAIGAIVATFVPAVGAHSWYAILAVTSIPFLVGVAQVVFERSGWTALSTALIFALALALVVTRRAGLGAPLRLAAAAILVPSLAVVAVCLGAQLLPSSGSPVVLPVIALIVAAVLPSGPLVRGWLVPRIGEKDATLVRVAIEASTLLTAAIAVALAVVREAAGLSTTLIVLLVLGVGGLATAVRGGRAYGWWLAGAAFTGALWCTWGLAGITLVEPYLLPPALGAAAIGASLATRGRPALRLYSVGLLAAVLPLLAVLAVDGSQLRAVGMLVGALVLVLLGWLLARGRQTDLATVTFGTAVLAAAAGAVEGVRLGAGRDAAFADVPTFFGSLTLGLAAGLLAAVAAGGVRRVAPAESRPRRSRWVYAPAFVYPPVAVWLTIEADWVVIWSMWALMACLLVALVAIARRGLRGPTCLPPVWFVFALAFATAVVAWSPRELRVEWFSLPLGAALLVAGALGMRAVDRGGPRATAGPRVADWPAGWSGSWPLLGPGLVVTLSASVTATFTDPLTWRAILVIVLALAAILIGASRRLAAPFLIGIVVLPIENAIAFAVQIGRGIQSMPWWITLAVVGAVLLIIAVTYERRAGEQSGIAARLRDLA
jgi:hypothetical protein